VGTRSEGAVSHSRADWEATGAFQVGVACQASGRYNDAIAAYRKVLRRDGFKEHVPTLHNLAVSQIRAQDAKEALRTLDEMERIIAAHAKRPGMLERRWNARYNRALALQYLHEYEAALDVTRELLGELLEGTEVHKLEALTLMLHAGLMLSVKDPLVADTPKTRHIPDVVKECAISIAKRRPDSAPPTREALRAAIGKRKERPGDIDAYVMHHYADDARARYNLLCFHARLADRLASARHGMQGIASEDAKVAFRDQRLATWASHDPALKLNALTDDAGWRKILTPPKPYAS
jgi:tetratricopeptide (TPR) repeat protein